jgi:putative intracellular protease/amidase
MRDRWVLVLWAPKFEEVAASVFVTTLRAAGIQVKLVGLASELASGSHGLGLMPDWSLEEALPRAGQAECVVIPCRSEVVRRLAQDPRVRELLWSVQAQHAPVVVSAGSAAVLGDLHLVPPPNGSLVTFSFEEDLPAFAQGLVGLLLLPAG